MCDTKAQVEEARQRVSTVLTRLGLELHPEKTRTVDLSRGREGFDFLGCHLRKRMSGPLWERTRRRVYFLQRWPSPRAMTRMRTRVRELTPRVAVSRGPPPHHRGPESGAARLGPVLSHGQRGDEVSSRSTRYVEDRLHGLLVKRAGSRPRPGRADRWRRPFFEALGLHRLRGTIQYPGAAQCGDLKTTW